MGNLGSVIGALLQGASQGFLEEQEDQKARERLQKETVRLEKRETAKAVLANPDLREEFKPTVLAFLSGQKGAEKPFDELLATGRGQIPVTGQAPALPRGDAGAVINRGGDLERDQNQAFALGFEGREGPLPLEEGPPAPTEEALARQIEFETLEERPLFRTREEKQAEAKGLIREQAGLEREEAALLANQQFAQTTADLEATVESVSSTLALAQDSVVKQALLGAVQLAASGQPELFQNLLNRAFNPSISMQEALATMGTIDLTTTSNDQVVEQIRSQNPLAADSLEDFDIFVRRAATKARRAQSVAERTAEAEAQIKEAETASSTISARLTLFSQATGFEDVKDFNTHIRGMEKLKLDATVALSKITEAINEKDSLGQEKPDALKAELALSESLLQAQVLDITNRLNDSIETREAFLNPSAEEEIAEIAPPGEEGANALEELPMTNRQKQQHIVNLFAELNEAAAFNLSLAFVTTDDPRFQIDDDERKLLLERAAKSRGGVVSPRTITRQQQRVQRPELAEIR